MNAAIDDCAFFYASSWTQVESGQLNPRASHHLRAMPWSGNPSTFALDVFRPAGGCSNPIVPTPEDHSTGRPAAVLLSVMARDGGKRQQDHRVWSRSNNQTLAVHDFNDTLTELGKRRWM